MRVTYDRDVDALYIQFLEATVSTHHIAAGVAVDYTNDGRIAGIEILDARHRFSDLSVFQQVVVEDMKPAVAIPMEPKE